MLLIDYKIYDTSTEVEKRDVIMFIIVRIVIGWNAVYVGLFGRYCYHHAEKPATREKKINKM
mgnify:CR=1 FL=1